MPDIAAAAERRYAALAPRELGLVGQVATSWALAGGLVAALIVTAHMVAQRLSSSLGFLTLTLFFVAGALVAFLHGAILAYLGRPPSLSRHAALRRLALASLYALPTLLGGWAAAMCLGLSAVALRSGRVGVALVSLLGWVVVIGALAWAWVATRRAMANLCRRWSVGHSVVVALGLVFLALLPIFLATRPEIWIVGIRPTRTAAVFMAIAATLWIGGPVLTLLALARRAWHRRRLTGPE